MTVEAPVRPELILKQNPAVVRPGWLPKGIWPELTELAEQHEAAIAQVERTRGDAVALKGRYKDEDAAQVQAYKDGAAEPEMTPASEREVALKRAEAKAEAAQQRLGGTVERCIKAIREREQTWQADLATRVADAEAKRQEARRLLAEADRAVGEVTRTRRWVQRSAQHKPRLGHVAHDQIGVPLPAPEPDLANISGWGSLDNDVTEAVDA